jgi:hypothetical protein
MVFPGELFDYQIGNHLTYLRDAHHIHLAAKQGGIPREKGTHMVKRKVANGDDNSAPKKSAKKAAGKRRKSSSETAALLVLVPKGISTRSAKNDLPRLPNPWPPIEITPLLICACVAPVAKIVLELIKVWVDDRKSRKVKIKNGDFEIEIQGGMSKRMLKSRFDEFRRMTKELDEDNVKIILPPGTDRALPRTPEDKKRR